MTAFVSRKYLKSQQLETELTEANIDSRAQSSLVVCYLPGGKFQSL